MSSENGGGFLTGFFIGAALGAMAALLLAPKTGRELRETLSAEGKKIRQKAEEAVSDLKAHSEDAFDKTKEAFRGAADSVKDAARSFNRG
jgi:gas vesicle protein